ncbi:hypothetical protein BBJ28_00004566 [Nothophytophthora sp. Chile5]|nr:hypothetical protein BBJ28_00004566 [Nothophytophthora sp. Chile5]
MESKGADGSRPSSKPSEGSWWRWTHGKSGSISSSSHGGSSLANSHVGGVLTSNSHSSSSSSSKSTTTSSSDAVRWQKRTTRSGLSPKEETANTSSFGDTWSSTISSPAGSSAITSSPKFFSVASSSRSARPTAVGSKKKVATPLSSRYGREGSAKKAPIVAAPSSTFVFSASAREDKHTLSSEISWSMGTSKRTVGRKNKKSGKSVSSTLYSSRGGARSAAARSARFLPDVNEDTEMRAPDASTNAFVFAPPQSQFKDYSGLPLSRYDLSNDQSEPAAPPLDFDGSFSQCSKPVFVPTSPSTASTTSTTSSFTSQSFSKADPLVDCARAVLQDCIRQRQMEQSTARKRTAGSMQESKNYGWQYGSVSKSSEYGMMSSGASGEKAERGCESKLAREEVYRQILVGDYDLSSSPEYQCFSPLPLSRVVGLMLLPWIVELDQLEMDVSRMTVDDEDTEVEEPTYLVWYAAGCCVCV